MNDIRRGTNNNKNNARSKCKIKKERIKHDVKNFEKHKLIRQKKPPRFYSPLFSWSPLVEATP